MIEKTSIYNDWNEIKEDMKQINRIQSVIYNEGYLNKEDRNMLLNIQSAILSLKNKIAKIPQVSFSYELGIYLSEIDGILNKYHNYLV